MRRAYRVVTLAVVAAAVPAMASAQTSAMRPFNAGVQANYGADTDFGVGVRYENNLNTLIASMPNLRAVASFDYYFPSGFNYWQLNAGLVMGFTMPGAPVAPYAGAALAYSNLKADIAGASSVSDVGLNLIGGVRFRPMGTMTPFAEVRLGLGGVNEQFVISGGLLIF